jgi:glycosyltransferase involved in cell wall biosynthesis
MDMRRVLLIDLSQRFGGADIRVVDVAARLASRFDLHVAVLQTGGVRERLQGTGVTLWPMARSRRDPRLVGDLFALMRRLRPHVVDAHNTQSQLWGLSAARLLAIPRRIATVHSILEQSEAGGVRPYLYSVYYALLQALASEGVAVCDAVGRHMLSRGFRRRPLHVIANGIALPDRRHVAAKPPRRKGSLRVAIVGRLVAVKGHAFLLEALARLVGKLAEVECLVIGDGPDRALLEERARTLGLENVVRFLGHRSDVLALVAGVDVLAMPSLTEGLPYAALEAAMLSVPIVASAVGGLAEELSHGATARLFPVGDVTALTRELAWCADHPEAATTQAARAREMVERRFAMRTMIEETAALYSATHPAPVSRLSDRPFAKAPSLGR